MIDVEQDGVKPVRVERGWQGIVPVALLDVARCRWIDGGEEVALDQAASGVVGELPSQWDQPATVPIYNTRQILDHGH